MSEIEKQNAVDTALKLSDFFKVEITVSIFGRTLIHYVFPPLKSK